MTNEEKACSPEKHYRYFTYHQLHCTEIDRNGSHNTRVFPSGTFDWGLGGGGCPLCPPCLPVPPHGWGAPPMIGREANFVENAFSHWGKPCQLHKQCKWLLSNSSNSEYLRYSICSSTHATKSVHELYNDSWVYDEHNRNNIKSNNENNHQNSNLAPPWSLWVIGTHQNWFVWAHQDSNVAHQGSCGLIFGSLIGTQKWLILAYRDSDLAHRESLGLKFGQS